MKLTRTVVYLQLVLAAVLFAGSAGDGYAQGAKMTVGQTGTNPGRPYTSSPKKKTCLPSMDSM